MNKSTYTFQRNKTHNSNITTKYNMHYLILWIMLSAYEQSLGPPEMFIIIIMEYIWDKSHQSYNSKIWDNTMMAI